MARIRLFVFALTPRAGARHHVYLVGRDAPRLKRRIEQLAPEINRTVASAQQPVVTGPGFVVAWHTVLQPTTGRTAPEWICVASDPAASLKPLEKATDWLAAKLNELAQIVTRRPWNDVGPLFEKLSELQPWQHELEKTSHALFQVRPEDAPPPQPQQPRKRSRRRWLLLFLLVACLLTLALRFSEELSRCTKWLIEKITGIKPPEIPWQPLAEALGVQNATPQEILEKLQMLFEPDQQAGSLAAHELPELKIEKILQDFEKAMGRSGKGKLSTLCQSPTLLKELRSLFPQGQFDPMGLVEGLPPTTAQFWRSLPPRDFDTLQNSLAQAAKNSDVWQVPEMSEDLVGALGLKEQMPFYLEIFRRLAAYTPSQGPDEPEQTSSQRRFYVPSQKDSLRKVHDVLKFICQACNELKKQKLNTSSASSGISQEEVPCEDNVKDCLQNIVTTLQERVPRAIENTKTFSNPDEENLKKFRQALEALENLVNKWKEVEKCR